ncbi:MAG: phosphatase PAP2 family protein [Fimbriimonadaceae bacterium]|nr:phosphatase PAP2 family protein [Fimbriimonadaceae bacterium]QYK55225.1 MAG: phosphatase PAP2 family protein [Fimbriimonadaceae bacterium]
MTPLWQVDVDLFREIHVGLRRAWLDPVMVVASDTGLGYLQFAGLAVAWLRGRQAAWAPWLLAGMAVLAAFLVERDPLASLAAVLVVALLGSLPPSWAARTILAAATAGLLRLAVEPLVDRQRPSVYFFAHPLEEVYGKSSFPSGHVTTTVSILVAVALLAYYERDGGGRPARGHLLVLALWAALVGLSRVYVGVHYPLDVVGGALFGATVATLAVFLSNRAARPE